MANLATLLGTWPKGMWESLIKVFYNGIGNYVVAIILLTLVIKVVLLPLDFFQRYKTSSFSRSQAYLKPQIDKLNKRYGNNQKLLNENLNKLYKDNNVKMGSSCLIILLSFVMNMVVLITFWNGMNAVSKYQITNQYDQYLNAYNTTYTAQISAGATEDEATIAGQQKVYDLYDDLNMDFLWIKNIWRPDSTVNAVPTFDDWTKIAGKTYKKDSDKKAAKEEYNKVMKLVLDKKQESNGYFILPVLVIAVMLVSQWLSRRSQLPPKEKRAQMSEDQLKQLKTGRIMMFVLPLIMMLFIVNTASLFAFYIFTSTLISTVTTPLITKAVNSIEKKQDEKREQEISVDYRRK